MLRPVPSVDRPTTGTISTDCRTLRVGRPVGGRNRKRPPAGLPRGHEAIQYAVVLSAPRAKEGIPNAQEATKRHHHDKGCAREIDDNLHGAHSPACALAGWTSRSRLATFATVVRLALVAFMTKLQDFPSASITPIVSRRFASSGRPL